MNEAIYKQPLVLLLGAGASKPLGLMTTPEFWQWYWLNSGFQPQILNALVESVKPSEEIGGQPDVEAVLDLLGKIKEARELQIGIFEKVHGVTASPKRTIEQIELDRILEDVLEDIKNSLIEQYFEVDSEAAYNLYQPIFKLAMHRPLPVFTTNYDRVIEKVYEHTFTVLNFVLIDGFSRERLTTPIWSRFAYEDYSLTEGIYVILFKLHGSVNWVRTLEGIQRVDIPQRDLGGAPTVIAYPSRQKREIHEEPFRTNYDYLLACLLHTKLCVVIGFSFRDQEIVEELRQAMELNENLRLMIIDPNVDAIQSHLETKLGFKPKAEFIKEEFSIENAQDIAHRIAQSIPPRPLVFE